MYSPKIDEFPPFSLTKLLRTCFGLSSETLRPCILIDLDNPTLLKDFSFLGLDGNSVQKIAIKEFLNPLNNGVGEELNFSTCSIYSYNKTGGSNLDPEDLFLQLDG